MELVQGWEQGTGLMIAGGLVALWYGGRLLIKLLKVIQRVIKRIMGAIARFLQPIVEFLYRSFYVLAHVAVAAGLGYVALGLMNNGPSLELIDQAELGASAVIVLGLTVIVFRHFLKFPLRKGQAQGLGNDAAEGGNFGDELDGDLDLPI
jgi:hypothetical protein